MTTSRRIPQLVAPFKVVSLAAAEGAVLTLLSSADNTVALPVGADPNPISVEIVGLALQAIVSTQTGADVVTAGVYPGIAAASITRGQLLTIADTSGGVKPAAPSAGTNVGVIGYAMESASTGERVAIDIRIGSFQG